MKKLFVIGLAVLFALGSSNAFASVRGYTGNGEDLGHAQGIRGVGNIIDNQAHMAGKVDFPLNGFTVIGDGDGPADVTTTTTPAFLLDSNSKSHIRWTSGETSKVQITFTVPDDYSSGGVFKVLLGRSGFDAAPSIDFEVFVDTSLTAFDTAATDQTAVSIGRNVASGSPQQVTLSVTTDFDSLAAGDTVTLNLWRDSGGSESLLLYGASFVYNTRD